MAKTVLIVDDSPSMRQMVAYALQTGGFTVLEAGNGRDALLVLDKTQVQLIITDLNMPVMDGVTFIQEARSKAKYKFTPILMLTTETDDAKKQSARTAGATGWLTKPFNADTLLKTVAKVLP